MSESNRHSPHYLIGRYLSGDLSQEESHELLDLLRRNKTVVSVIKANLLSDAWLNELKDIKSEKTNEIDSEDFAKLFAVSLNSVENSNDLTKCPSTEYETDVELDWDELIRLQNAEKPIAQMSSEEIHVYRSKLANSASDSYALTHDSKEDKDFDPFAILYELEEREKQLYASGKSEGHHWDINDFFFITSIIAAIVLGFGVYFESHCEVEYDSISVSSAIEEDFRPVAKIVELIDPVWAENSEKYSRGQNIDIGELVLKRGMAKVEFQNGAKVILIAPVRFAIDNELDTFCHFGQLSATIPPTATGFRVNTPLGTVEDRGTEFFIEVGKNFFEVETHKGLVEITTMNRHSVPLQQGSGLHVNRNSTHYRLIEKNSRFTTLETFGRWLALYTDKLRKEKSRENMTLDADPNVLVRFDANQRTGNHIPNSSMVGKEVCSGLNVSSTSVVPGRWHDSPAIGFTKQTGKCSFRLDGSYRRLILTAHIRFDHLGTQENTLCASCDFLKVPGSFLWQICRTGELLLFITDQENHVNLYSSSSIMKMRDCGVWFALSVVIDADTGTISHYVNSRLITKVPWKQPQNITPGECLLGRAPRGVLKGSGKQFDGAIDEFQISTRN